MKTNIPKAFHPILGIIVGTIFFLVGIAIMSAAFVAMYKGIQYAAPFVSDAYEIVMSHLVK